MTTKAVAGRLDGGRTGPTQSEGNLSCRLEVQNETQYPAGCSFILLALNFDMCPPSRWDGFVPPTKGKGLSRPSGSRLVCGLLLTIASGRRDPDPFQLWATGSCAHFCSPLAPTPPLTAGKLARLAGAGGRYVGSQPPPQPLRLTSVGSFELALNLCLQLTRDPSSIPASISGDHPRSAELSR